MKSRRYLRLIALSMTLVMGSLVLQGCGLIEIFAEALGRVCERPLVVSTTTDKDDNTCLPSDCSLREAVDASNDCTGRQTIQLPAGTYTLSLTDDPEALNESGDLDLWDTVTIEGIEGDVVIDGNGTDGVFQLLNAVGEGDPVVIRNLTIRNGHSQANGGAINVGNHAELQLTDVTLRNNEVSDGGAGGAIFVAALGALRTSNVSMVGNRSSGEAGAVFVDTDGLFESEETVLESNVAAGGYNGGGIFNRGFVTFRGDLLGNITGGFGGGIVNFGDFEFAGGDISDNSAGIGGGGIANFGQIEILGASLLGNEAPMGAGLYSAPERWNLNARTSVADTLFRNNTTTGDGSGVWNGERSLLIINGSAFASNSANDGGAIFNLGESYVIDSSIRNNSANAIGARDGEGGGIRNAGLMTVVRTTIAGNQADFNAPVALDGSAIHNSGNLSLHNVTVSGNTSAGEVGAALFTLGEAVNASHITVVENSHYGIQGSIGGGVGIDSFRLTNSLIGPNGAENCVRPLASEGGNLFTDETCGPDTALGDLTVSDPRIGPLASNGGSNLTHALESDSPAIDLGVDESCRPTDQRGVGRPFGDGCDAGAFELEEELTPTPMAAGIDINFNADRYTIERNQCTTLRWQVSGASSILLLGQEREATAAQQVCPDETTGYTLFAENETEEAQSFLQIEVTEPQIDPGPQEGCFVNGVCTVPCPGDPQQYGGVCTK